MPVHNLLDGLNTQNFNYEQTDISPIHGFIGESAFLSNFHPSPITYQGTLYPTVEHAYQAAKTHNFHEKEEVRKAKTPSEAKRLGKSVEIRPDWEEVKLMVMLDLLLKKFTQGSRLEERLLQTGHREIIESNWWCDMYWGSCECPYHRHKTGRNMLGKLLTIIRDFKRNCPYLEPNVADKEQIVLAVVTRSKAQDFNQKKKNSGPAQNQQAGVSENSDRFDPTQFNANTNRRNGADAESVAEALRSASHLTDTRENIMQNTSIGSTMRTDQGDQVELSPLPADSNVNTGDEKTWNQSEILNSTDTVKYFSDNYYFLSNYAPSKFTVEGEKFLSVEDALNTKGFRFCDLTYAYPHTIKTTHLDKLRNQLKESTRKAAVEFLRKCLTAKFTQNTDLQERLLETKDKLLVYCNKICDNYLGLCLCSKCTNNSNVNPLNLLGTELMKIRSLLIKDKELMDSAESLDSVPPIDKLIAFQRGDPNLMKIIETFNPQGT
ncbi:Riboflavin biosynthesis protein VVA0006 [Frankliniella fusca]|uniref:Riboflavin biosynthesis protein VVA0006 n=1 Tax=Frankliniella fusca TaxID=407009 RepID=A0AAE1H6Y6_9NEOP|nr:Riboflavin biosynthesis protein VVA0006 [Frankliniella fusca]